MAGSSSSAVDFIEEIIGAVSSTVIKLDDKTIGVASSGGVSLVNRSTSSAVILVNKTIGIYFADVTTSTRRRTIKNSSSLNSITLLLPSFFFVSSNLFSSSITTFYRSYSLTLSITYILGELDFNEGSTIAIGTIISLLEILIASEIELLIILLLDIKGDKVIIGSIFILATRG